MKAFNQYISEVENGFKCVWIYNSGDIPDYDEEEEEMWNSSLSSIPDEEREQEEAKDAPVDDEKRTVPKRGNTSFYSERDIEISVNTAVSSALERAREKAENIADHLSDHLCSLCHNVS
ncbi:MAG: hypothetical protein SGBAC_004292 [Bacillariaceae sp.]